MSLINKYTNLIPYLYFIAITAYWFTMVNKIEGITAYPILLFGIPFLWQIIKPNHRLNFTLGITFVCISSYLILAFLSDAFKIIALSYPIKQLMIYGGLFVFANFIMALWIIRNSLKERI
ncbi:hypothetical protein GCM10023314_15610 [Algibacter agarivorans]|uniref:Uncharacterized protein n=1 Tax=Algibacter agarivorans TaxID=1109741 RepID=A0ABP9GNY7_9FLAO